MGAKYKGNEYTLYLKVCKTYGIHPEPPIPERRDFNISNDSNKTYNNSISDTNSVASVGSHHSSIISTAGIRDSGTSSKSNKSNKSNKLSSKNSDNKTAKKTK